MKPFELEGLKDVYTDTYSHTHTERHLHIHTYKLGDRERETSTFSIPIIFLTPNTLIKAFIKAYSISY